MPRMRTSVGDDAGNDLHEENELLRDALVQAQASLGELRRILDGITAPPWHPCLFQRLVGTSAGTRALVSVGPAPRLVSLHPDVAGEALVAGDLVFLDPEQRAILGRADGSLSLPTESASFVRTADDGRLVVCSRGEELMLDRAARMNGSAPRAGDVVLFDRPSRLAFELLPSSAGQQYLLEAASDLPCLSYGQVGDGRDRLDELVAVLGAALVEPELATRYGLGGRRAILLHGPPGCGKTLLARTAAAELQRRTGRRCRFAVVRPGEFESPYVGESEANIRACFAALAEAADGGMAIVFLDEIEAIGRIRGGLGARHADRSLAALLAEIDGFRRRGDVAILAATNRRDLLDPALLSRLSDVQIAVPRPDQRMARAIFAVHLAESLPYRESGAERAAEPGSAEADAVRSRLLDTAVSRLYAPNAENELARLTFRDGSTRVVLARELMSGRLIEQICLSVRERGFRRDTRGEAPGVCEADAAGGVAEAISRLSNTLSVHNVRSHLDDLPDDLDVVRVEPLRPRPERRHRYRHVA